LTNTIHLENMKQILLKNIQVLNSSTFLYFISTFYIFLITLTSDTIFEVKNYLNFRKTVLYKKIDLIKEEEITIYRIEDNSGVGPYQTRLYDTNLLDIIETDNTPSPYTDMEDVWNFLEYKNLRRDFKFGFTSMEQLNAWFSKKELKKLMKNGFCIEKYSSNIYHTTDKQVVFKIC